MLSVIPVTTTKTDPRARFKAAYHAWRSLRRMREEIMQVVDRYNGGTPSSIDGARIWHAVEQAAVSPDPAIYRAVMTATESLRSDPLDPLLPPYMRRIRMKVRLAIRADSTNS